MPVPGETLRQCIFRNCIPLVALLVALFVPMAAHATDYNDGDPCVGLEVGAWHEGNDGDGFYGLICNGSIWDEVIHFRSAGSVSIKSGPLEVKQGPSANRVILTNDVERGLEFLSGGYPDQDVGIIGYSSSNDFLMGTYDQGASTFKGFINRGTYNSFMGQTYDIFDPAPNAMSGIQFVDNGIKFYTGGDVAFVDMYAGVTRFPMYSNNPPTSGNVEFQRFRGTTAAPLPVVTGDSMGRIAFRGLGSLTLRDAALMEVVVDSGTVSTTIPAKFSFSTTPGGGTALTERFTILGNGRVGIAKPAPVATLDVNGSVAYSADISPAAIGADVIDYAPTGHATATLFRLTANTPNNVTGLAGGADGRIVHLVNIGPGTLTLTNQDAASAAANRFLLGANLTLAANQSVVLAYDSTSSRWRPVSAYGSGSVTGASGADRQIQFNSSGAFATDGNLVFTSAGFLGVGTPTPSSAVHVVGDIQYTGVITDISDERQKKDIAQLTGALEKIEAIRGVSFRMKDDPRQAVELGLIAQDVQEVYPELVKTHPGGALSLNYQGMVGPLVEAVKELDAVNAQQDAEIAELRRLVDELMRTDRVETPSCAGRSPYND